jgi:uracil-DNA glycosylase family 4
MSAAPVIEYLRQLELQGQTHVNVDNEARLILRAFYMRARGSAGKVPTRVSQVAPTQKESQVAQPPAHQVAEAAESTPQLVVSGSSAAEKIINLKQQVAGWPPIRALDGLRQTLVFSVGNPEADVMLIGEAPGYDEERLGEPFVGKAGQKLDGILKAMGIARRDVYMTNVVKFRPAMSNQTTNNRKPTSEEMEACMPFIREEVKVVAPKVIIVLGSSPAQALLDSEGSVESQRGKFHELAGVPVRVTYHPS